MIGCIYTPFRWFGSDHRIDNSLFTKMFTYLFFVLTTLVYRAESRTSSNKGSSDDAFSGKIRGLLDRGGLLDPTGRSSVWTVHSVTVVQFVQKNLRTFKRCKQRVFQRSCEAAGKIDCARFREIHTRMGVIQYFYNLYYLMKHFKRRWF